jgi:hypothetical protein
MFGVCVVHVCCMCVACVWCVVALQVLVCAPSNAAVDEIVSRLLSVGVWNVEGQLVHPRLVRMGISVSTDTAVSAATLDAQVRKLTCSLQVTPRRRDPASVGSVCLGPASHPCCARQYLGWQA